MKRIIATSVALAILAACSRPQAETGAVNDLPNPYRTVRDWAKLPRGMEWAAVTAVEPAPDGSIYVVHRCHENSCEGRPEAPILKFDRNGHLVKSWGEGMFVFPHGSTIDSSGNLWVTDAAGANGIGHQVFQFSPEGEVLMTLGRKGVAGSGPDTFHRPTDVVVAPSGEIFVADGHRPEGNNRIVKFARDGTFVKEWGGKGVNPGQLNEPHTIALDGSGRLFVGDRVNNRIQIFDQDGNFEGIWIQFGRPSGIAILGPTIYVTDSESGPDQGFGEDPAWRKGIRIGDAASGTVRFFIPDREADSSEHAGAEGIGVDASGNVYGAVVRRRGLELHIPTH